MRPSSKLKADALEGVNLPDVAPITAIPGAGIQAVASSNQNRASRRLRGGGRAGKDADAPTIRLSTCPDADQY